MDKSKSLKWMDLTVLMMTPMRTPIIAHTRHSRCIYATLQLHKRKSFIVTPIKNRQVIHNSCTLHTHTHLNTYIICTYSNDDHDASMKAATPPAIRLFLGKWAADASFIRIHLIIPVIIISIWSSSSSSPSPSPFGPPPVSPYSHDQRWW